MKICFVAEGCYPYEIGGVSSWIHSIIKAFPDDEFSLIAIVTGRDRRGDFKYQLPDNLVSVTEVYLNDCDWVGRGGKQKKHRLRLNARQRAALESLVVGDQVDWDGVFNIFERPNVSVNALLMGPDFLDVVMQFYRLKFDKVPFTDFLWTMRSIYLTLFLALKCVPPQADIYHCVATGYAGVIGAFAKARHPGSRLLISEHGIYTREREEEIIRAKWLQGIFKDIWIAQFRKMSLCAYAYADKVTALFEQSRQLQLELGCPKEKTLVTPNGIDVEALAGAPGKDPGEDSFNIGAILRITPIKDVKTMLTAFHYAASRNPRLKLYVMGPSAENETYAQECYDLVKSQGTKNVIFTGPIRTAEYIGRMDMTLLTSISEGQPLTILESFAAGKPCVATNVGNCQGLIYGESDDFGAAGIVVPIMNVPEIADAILYMAEDEARCRAMGEIGRKRVTLKYKTSDMRSAYTRLYRSLSPRD